MLEEEQIWGERVGNNRPNSENFVFEENPNGGHKKAL